MSLINIIASILTDDTAIKQQPIVILMSGQSNPQGEGVYTN